METGSCGNKRKDLTMMKYALWCRLFIQLHTAASKAYCAILVRRSNFRHQASPRLSPRESTQRRKVELWSRNVREFYLNSDFTLLLGIFYMP